MDNKLEDPLAGDPKTRVDADEAGLPRFTIRPRVLTPFRARVSDELVCLIACLILPFAAWCWFESPGRTLQNFLGGLVIAVPSAIVLATIAQAICRHTTTIVMTTDAITVKGLFGSVRYDRNLEHRFALLQHDKAREEYLRHDLAVREAAANGKVIQKKAYYGESYHVALSYAGHRRDLLIVYGPAEATAIVARLQFCDRCLNEAVRMGGGIHQRPEDEWNDAPGDLRDA